MSNSTPAPGWYDRYKALIHSGEGDHPKTVTIPWEYALDLVAWYDKVRDPYTGQQVIVLLEEAKEQYAEQD